MKKALAGQFKDKKFVVFLLVSSIAASVNFFSRIIFGDFFSFEISVLIAYVLGMLVAYVLCRRFVFNPQKNTQTQEVFYFTLVNIFGMLITWVVSLFFADDLLLFIHQPFLREEMAHGIGIMAPAFTSYLGHKYLSFK